MGKGLKPDCPAAKTVRQKAMSGPAHRASDGSASIAALADCRAASVPGVQNLYCTNCGIPRTREANYCHNCGRSFDARLAGSTSTGLDQKESPRLVPWRGGQVALGILLVVAMLIPVVAIAFGIDRGLDRYDEAVSTWVSVHVMGLAILVVVWRLGLHGYRAPISALGLVPWRIPKSKTVFMTVGASGPARQKRTP